MATTTTTMTTRTPATKAATATAAPTPTATTKRGQALTERRKGIPVLVRGRSLAEIARTARIDQSYISKVSRGQATPSYAALQVLRDVLGASSTDEALAWLRADHDQRSRRKPSARRSA